MLSGDRICGARTGCPITPTYMHRGSRAGSRHRLRYRSVAAYCKKNGIALLVVSYPELHHLKPYPFAKITEAVKRVAEENSVPFLDLLPAIEHLEPKALWVSPTDAHPNSIADQAFAESINSFLRSLGLMGRHVTVSSKG